MRRDAYENLHTVIAAMFGLMMMAMPSMASAEVLVRPVHPVVVARGRRAVAFHDHRVLSAVGMREPVLPPSPLVALPLIWPGRGR